MALKKQGKDNEVQELVKLLIANQWVRNYWENISNIMKELEKFSGDKKFFYLIIYWNYFRF